MDLYTVIFQPDNITVLAESGITLLQAQIQAGLHPDAPCGGNGSCGKCLVSLDGQEVLSCRTVVDRNMTVTRPHRKALTILTDGLSADITPDRSDRYCLAFDIGTTTVVAYLLNGHSGKLLSHASAINPQAQFGADVISRIQYAMDHGSNSLRDCIRGILTRLTWETAQAAGIAPHEITVAAIVCNTAMHHLLLGIDPATLVTPPYMPAVFDALELPAKEFLPITGSVRVLPNITGYVGSDTVGCMVSTRFDTLDKPALLIDIGTNGEMVLGNKRRRITCSTAAGPAFEGANISCGMRGAPGAVDHVRLEGSEVKYHTIGEHPAAGLCGSGLLDLVAVLLDIGIIDGSGCLDGSQYRLGDTGIILTQKDVREVQLAKAAIRAGIQLLSEKFGITPDEIAHVYLAGAFGNYMTPDSACRIGMIPPCLKDRIHPIGNAAGEGAKLCALSRREFEYAKTLAQNTEFLELASIPQFQDYYVDALEFAEDNDDDL